MRIRSNNSQSRWQNFWTDTRKWIQSRRGVLQFFMAVLLGFILAATFAFWYNNWGGQAVVDPFVQLLFVEAEETIEEVTVTNDLPIMYFDIPFEEYQAMAQKRDEALESGILLLDDEDWQRAQIRFQSETIPVKVRLKGDWTDHLEENKWSFRIKTRGDAAIMGMRSFSVQSPGTRGYLDEWLFMKDLRRSGILAPRYLFLNVAVNGEDWGIYALEESFSKELLESQQRREGPIVRFDESLLWQHRALYGGNDPIGRTLAEEKFALVDDFNTNQTQDNFVLLQQSMAALGLLRGFQDGELLVSEVFDPELMGQYLAHTNLWNASHGLIWHNERYYYNPLTSRLAACRRSQVSEIKKL